MERDDECGRWSNILGANTRLANAMHPMLQDNNPDAACMYVHTSFDIYERESTVRYGTARQCWLSPTLSPCLRCRALIGTYLVCCFAQRGDTAVLCCPVRCCARGVAVDTQRQYNHTHYCCCIPVLKKPTKQWEKRLNANAPPIKKLGHMLGLAKSFCLLALRGLIGTYLVCCSVRG